MSRPLSIPPVGTRFGRLEVVSEETRKKEGGWILIKARCECGVEKWIPLHDLRKMLSCGCKQYDRARTQNGASISHPNEYNSWRTMIARCSRHDASGYATYGGRGITVCQSWRDSFWDFFNDMGVRPEGYSLERIDVNGNYEPSNCKWIPMKQQARNRTDTLVIGNTPATVIYEAHLRSVKVPYRIFKNRVFRLGWPVHKALFTPSLSKKSKSDAAPKSS